MTNYQRFMRLGFLAATLATMSFACTVVEGDSSDNDDGASSGSGNTSAGQGGATGSGSTGSGSAQFVCCINDATYSCPNEAALDQCAGFDLDGCMDQCDFDDFDCNDACFDALANSTPDPSACTEDASVNCDGSGSGPTSGPTGGGGTCIGEWDGAYCEKDSDCSSYNCVDDKCYGKEVGNPCDQDSDCGSYNCYSGCCNGNEAGASCDQDSDCTSYNCYDDVCQ